MEGDCAVEEYKARGRDMMTRRGNVIKIVSAFLFCVLISVAVMMIGDAVVIYFVPKRFEYAATLLTYCATFTAYAMADVFLVRFGIRLHTGDMTPKKRSGASAYVAMGIGFMCETLVLAFLYAYVEVFSAYVSRVFGVAINGLCMLLTGFLACVAVFCVGTGLFFLPAVAEKEKKSVFGLLIESQRAAKGRRLKAVKFILSFAPLTFCSFFSLGVLFFVYVLPLYILSYGAFVSEVLD